MGSTTDLSDWDPILMRLHECLQIEQYLGIWVTRGIKTNFGMEFKVEKPLALLNGPIYVKVNINSALKHYDGWNWANLCIGALRTVRHSPWPWADVTFRYVAWWSHQFYVSIVLASHSTTSLNKIAFWIDTIPIQIKSTKVLGERIYHTVTHNFHKIL